MSFESTDRTARELADVIAEHRQTIENRWLERVKTDVLQAAGAELTQLRDGLPDYLDAMVDLLRRGNVDDISPLSQEAWSKIAQEHGVTRVRLGFDITQLVHEFVVLRHVIEDVARGRAL